jgi:hypothetical protein
VRFVTSTICAGAGSAGGAIAVVTALALAWLLAPTSALAVNACVTNTHDKTVLVIDTAADPRGLSRHPGWQQGLCREL